MNNQMIESSFNEEKALNKILKEKLEKLEFDYNNINRKICKRKNNNRRKRRKRNKNTFIAKKTK